MIFSYEDPGMTLCKKHTDHISCQFIAIYVEMKVELPEQKKIMREVTLKDKILKPRRSCNFAFTYFYNTISVFDIRVMSQVNLASQSVI